MGRKIKKNTLAKRHAHWQAEQILMGLKLYLDAGGMSAADRESFYMSVCKQLWSLRELSVDRRYSYVQLASRLRCGLKQKPSGPTLIFENSNLTTPKDVADYKKRMRLA